MRPNVPEPVLVASKNASYFVRNFVGHRSGLFPTLRFTRFRTQMVGPDTDLLIDGFPRSGNSFFFNYFYRANPGYSIAHHVHVAGQFYQAYQRGIPAVLLLRAPEGCLSSLLIIDRRLHVGLAVSSFVEFLEHMLALPELPVVVPFEVATQRPQDAIAQVNARYGTAYATGHLNDEVREGIFESLEQVRASDAQPQNQVARPSLRKDALKAAVRDSIVQHRLFPRAMELFQQVEELGGHTRGSDAE